jgi:FixJ family two-component response regulator
MGLCRLSKKEIAVLEKLLVCDVSVAALDLGIKPSTIYVIRARVRGKIEQARDLLQLAKKYRKALGTSY